MITRRTAIDDNGDGLSGTAINNLWLQSLYDDLDGRWSQKTILASGTLNNLVTDEADLLILTPTADTIITGIAAPVGPAKPGKTITLINLGNYPVFLAHNSSSSVPSARLRNLVKSGYTPIAAVEGGSATYIRDDTNNCWRLVYHDQGSWINAPYNASEFLSLTGTWSVADGDRITDAYYIRGRQMTYALRTYQTDVVGGPSNTLQRVLPGGYTVGAMTLGCFPAINNGYRAIADWFGANASIYFQTDSYSPGATPWNGACWINTTSILIIN